MHFFVTLFDLHFQHPVGKKTTTPTLEQLYLHIGILLFRLSQYTPACFMQNPSTSSLNPLNLIIHKTKSSTSQATQPSVKSVMGKNHYDLVVPLIKRTNGLFIKTPIFLNFTGKQGQEEFGNSFSQYSQYCMQIIQNFVWTGHNLFQEEIQDTFIYQPNNDQVKPTIY